MSRAGTMPHVEAARPPWRPLCGAQVAFHGGVLSLVWLQPVHSSLHGQAFFSNLLASPGHRCVSWNARSIGAQGLTRFCCLRASTGAGSAARRLTAATSRVLPLGALDSISRPPPHHPISCRPHALLVLLRPEHAPHLVSSSFRPGCDPRRNNQGAPGGLRLLRVCPVRRAGPTKNI